MRLLDTASLTLHEFFDDAIPSYAILSHRWGMEEVMFQDLEAGRGPRMKGWLKILGCCKQAAIDGWQYVWVDSCCIDKKSSAELSEAINSMFQWYRKSEVCYVYMSDVKRVPTGRDGDTNQHGDSEFRRSQWFTRGWTLQELIAPRSVVFYDRQWRELGTRKLLGRLITSITGISHFHFQDYTRASVAQKMSWASKRLTTRVEDRAYSLMGLFDVNMPTLYGEGWKAFERLQFEILAKSEDESIFAWNVDTVGTGRMSLLAETPAVFADSGNIIQKPRDEQRPPFMMTSRGLRMELFLLPRTEGRGYLVPLNCYREGLTGVIALVVFESAKPMLELFPGMPKYQRQRELTTLQDYKKPAKTSVIFVKPKDSAVESLKVRDSFRRLPLTFYLKVTSPLPGEFVVFKEGLDFSGLHKMVTRYVETYEQGGNKRIKANTTCEFVWLYFASYESDDSDDLQQFLPTQIFRWDAEKRDAFLVILRTPRRHEPFVQVFIPQNNQSWETEVSQDLDWASHTEFGTDRISRTMRSGRSVSVALRQKPEPGTLLYELDITIDSEGRLPWLDSDQNQTRPWND